MTKVGVKIKNQSGGWSLLNDFKKKISNLARNY